jgi:hypothetical protein
MTNDKKLKEYRKKYYEEHRQHYLDKAREYYSENKKEISERLRKTCKNCGFEFETIDPRQIYCSIACQKFYYRAVHLKEYRQAHKKQIKK